MDNSKLRESIPEFMLIVKMTMDVIANGNSITATYNDEKVLEIQIPIKLAVCEECGQIFVPVRKDQRFHTTKCRNRYNQRILRQRRKEAQA
jgi:hypothetical protein